MEEELIPVLGFKLPDVNIKRDTVVVSWRAGSYEELDSFCLYYRGVSFVESGLTYEELVRSVLETWRVGIKRELEKLIVGGGAA